MPARLLYALRRDWLLLILLAAFPVLFLLSPPGLSDLLHLVDWKTVCALAGLMVLSRGLEVSGLMDRFARWLLARLNGLRGLAVAMIALAAALSAVVTNDVALCVTVPLILGLARMVALPLRPLRSWGCRCWPIRCFSGR